MSILLENKKAGLNYQLLEEFEAGIELLGFEVKTLRSKHGSLLGAYVTIRGGEAFLVGANLPPYQVGNTLKSYDPIRTRRLLLTHAELLLLAGKLATAGLTLVPLLIYSKGPKLKLKLALAKGKKKHDKRATIRKREAEREIARTLRAH